MKASSVKIIVWVTYGSAALLNGILWVLTLSVFPYDSSATVLHYSQGIGIDMVGQGLNILVLPAGGLGLTLINAWLAWSVRHISKRAWWLLNLSIPLIQAILISAFVLLWRVNV